MKTAGSRMGYRIQTPVEVAKALGMRVARTASLSTEVYGNPASGRWPVCPLAHTASHLSNPIEQEVLDLGLHLPGQAPNQELHLMTTAEATTLATESATPFGGTHCITLLNKGNKGPEFLG
ncbi:unnamed protein product [Caretta caretta]